MKKITLLLSVTFILMIAQHLSAKSIISEAGFLSSLTQNDLDFSDKGIREFPKEILNMTEVEQLDLSNNKITTIPEDIQKLQHLRILKLGGNHIYELPAVISKLKFLKEIYLDRDVWQYRLTEIKKITSARIVLVG